MRLSQIARQINESATLRLNQVAATLRTQGEPVIHLGGGEPVSRAPADAVAAARRLLDTGEVRYTPAAGVPELRRAIAEHHEAMYSVKVDAANVIASGGAKQAIMVCMRAVLDPGDEVIFPVPYWVSYPEMVKLCGATPVPAAPDDDTLQMTLSAIERHVTPRTKLVLINSPSNPSGVLFSEAFIRDVVEYCERREIWLLMDDIYHRLVFGGREPANACRFANPDVERSRLVMTNGVSKSYAMTGFRLGWAVGPRELVQAMASIQGQETSGPSAISQAGAIGAIRGDQACVDELRGTLERNSAAMMGELAAIPNARCVRPDGTFYCFPDFGAYEPDSNRLCEFLLEKVRVVTVPGREFGMDGHLRLSTCGSADAIVEGVRRIRWALDPTTPREREIGGRTVVRDWL